MQTLLESQWRQLRGQVKERWGRLTGDDLDRIEGQTDQLIGRLQERYAYTREQAEAEVADFLESLKSGEEEEA